MQVTGPAGAERDAAAATEATDLTAIDDAFLRLRRLWASSRHSVLEGATAVELSSLLVVEACARCEERGEEANVSDVAHLADVTPSTASRLVDTAERAGLLDRRRSARSARQIALVLTDLGRQLRNHAVATRQSWLAAQLEGWSPAEVASFATLLQRFADELGDRPVRLPGAASPEPPPAARPAG